MNIFEILADHNVPFVVIGGHAVNYFGCLRATEDSDLIFRRNEASEKHLLTALQSVNALWISDEKDPETNLEKTVPVTLSYLRVTHIMALCTDLGYVDIFDHIPGFPDTPVDELFKHCETMGKIKFISLAWLRKLKAACGRPQDLLDLEQLPEA